jgi:hypothetical protein
MSFVRERNLSLYRVHFTWKGKELQLTARSLDLTHPYFVSIKDLVFTSEPKLIIDPSAEDVVKLFGDSKHLMIPFQTVQLIEESPDEMPAIKVRKFTIIENDQDGTTPPAKP